MYYNENTQIFLDGKWLKASEATTDLYAQTLHYGNGVFEGIRAYETPDGARIFKAKEHYERLLKSAELMHIPVGWTVAELIDLTVELLERNQLSNAYIRPLIFLGENMTLTPVSDSGLFLCAWEWGKYLGTGLQRLSLSPYRRPHPLSCHIEAKTVGHYTNSILASTEAKKRGFDEALLLDVNGFVAEGPGANIFLEKDEKLYTPPLGQILPGITRATIIELAAELGVTLIEKPITPEELKTADSAFYVGTAAEVSGIKSVDDYVFPLSWEDTIGAVLARMYNLKVMGQDYHHFELV